MKDATGFYREPGQPYAEQYHKDETGVYALVRYPDGSGIWRHRVTKPWLIQFPTTERIEGEFDNINAFRKAVLARPHMMGFKVPDDLGYRYPDPIQPLTIRSIDDGGIPEYEVKRGRWLEWLRIYGPVIPYFLIVAYLVWKFA